MNIRYKLHITGLFFSTMVVVLTAAGVGVMWVLSNQIDNGIVIDAGSASHELLKIAMMVIGACGLLTVLLMWAFAARILARVAPGLRQAREAAKMVSQGDYDAEVHIPGNDELSELGQSFNKMVNDFENTHIQLRREIEEKRAAQAHAQDAARSKSEFLANMSHEFRTPLNGILGYSQVLMMDPNLTERQAQTIRNMRRSGENFLELINDVLDLSKIEAKRMHIQPTRFYLGDLLHGIHETYSGQAQLKGLELTMFMADDLPDSIYTDEVRLRQILVNLVSNALKFTDEGTIDLRVVWDEDAHAFRFQVRDTGIGISAEDIERIKVPFQQVQHRTRSAKGTGLGLSISSRLLKLMGSTLQIDSQQFKGSCFWFDLEQPKQSDQKMVLSPRHISGYSGNIRTLWVIDPDTRPLGMIRSQLRHIGFTVRHSPGCAQALQDIREFKPDLFFIAQDLPDQTGLDAVHSLDLYYHQKREALPPIVLVTKETTGIQREKAIAAGCAEVLSRPLRYNQVLLVLQTLLKVNWIYADNTQTIAPIVAQETNVASRIEKNVFDPPKLPILREMEQYALSGDVRSLRKSAEQLLEDSRAYTGFAKYMMDLCSSYQVNRIVSFLRQTIAEAESASAEDEVEHL